MTNWKHSCHVRLGIRTEDFKPKFVVPDVLGALQRLAVAWRNELSDLEVVGVTGNVGKSTTKLITAALLPLAAHAQTALDEVMARKQINIAIPTDFPPYGFVSTDLKPQGLDVSMAQLIADSIAQQLDAFAAGNLADRIGEIGQGSFQLRAPALLCGHDVVAGDGHVSSPC
mgnify:CR=1 FL=1